jgi:hypothetical protein
LSLTLLVPTVRHLLILSFTMRTWYGAAR